MKKIIAAALLAGAFVSAGAHATGAGTPTPITLKTGYNGIGDVATNINLARQFAFTAIPSRAGFIKNDFEGTLSANVIAGVIDDAANNRMGVVAGSNKGYVVFTGSSVGGSVSQCGKPVVKGTDTANLAATLVVVGTTDLTKANGCNREI
ncbi:hypothetical protein [Stutzerimonas chloritidismutans]|uniref:hypothetical protein n=1 Tax=Stutzerimonas chloritidismutans TaxID=203192 RepID=UPI00384AB9F6